jgi:hypothetical protein
LSLQARIAMLLESDRESAFVAAMDSAQAYVESMQHLEQSLKKVRSTAAAGVVSQGLFCAMVCDKALASGPVGVAACGSPGAASGCKRILHSVDISRGTCTSWDQAAKRG